MTAKASSTGAISTPEAASALVGREVVITRVFDAPRDLVFKAWTDAKHLARWWGPHHFTNPLCEVDVRPGGAIRIDMQGPDGTVHAMKGNFREIVAPERLVFTTHVFEDERGEFGLETLTTVTFAEHGGQTTLTMRTVVTKASPEAAPAIGGMEMGWAQSLERLEMLVAEESGGFVISREFDAPRELVFKAWTEADRLRRWFGPKGFSVGVCTVDLRPGGMFHYSFLPPNGDAMWGRWVYREIVPPERLVHLFSFSDESGGVTRHPFAPDWPAEILSVVTFTECFGRTRVTMRSVPLNASAAELAAFEGGRESMKGGWAGNLDRLEAELAR